MQEREYWIGKEISSLMPNEIFVFGSNPGGYHGLGAAAAALAFGAVMKRGRGLYGQTYALVTKNLIPNFKEYSTGTVYTLTGKRSVSKEQIIENIRELYRTARQSPHLKFLISYRYEFDRNGNPKASLNGYYPDEMIEMFTALPVPDNIIFNETYKNSIEPILQAQKSKQQSSEKSTELKVPDQFRESRLQEARAQRGLPPYSKEELDELLGREVATQSVTPAPTASAPAQQAETKIVRRFSSKGAGTITQVNVAPVVAPSPASVNYNVGAVTPPKENQPVKKGGSFKPSFAVGAKPVEDETSIDSMFNSDEFTSFDSFEEDTVAVQSAPATAPAPLRKGGSFKPSFRLGSRPPEESPAEEVSAEKDNSFNDIKDATVAVQQAPATLRKGGSFKPSFKLGSRPPEESPIEEVVESVPVVAVKAEKEINPFDEFNGWDDAPVVIDDTNINIENAQLLGETPVETVVVSETMEVASELNDVDFEKFNEQFPNEQLPERKSGAFGSNWGAGNQTQLNDEDDINVKDLIPTDFLGDNADKDVAFFVVENNKLKPLVEDKRIVEKLNDSTTISEVKNKIEEDKARKAEEILNRYSAPIKQKPVVSPVKEVKNEVVVEEKVETVSDKPKFKLGSKVFVNPEPVVPEKETKAKTTKAKTTKTKTVKETKNVDVKTNSDKPLDTVKGIDTITPEPVALAPVVDVAPAPIVPEPVVERTEFAKQAGLEGFENMSFDDENTSDLTNIEEISIPVQVVNQEPVQDIKQRDRGFSRVVKGDVYDPFGDAYEIPEFLPQQNNNVSEVDMAEKTPFVRLNEISDEQKNFGIVGDLGVGVRTSLPVIQEEVPVAIINSGDDEDEDKLVPPAVIDPKPIVQNITVGVSRARFVRVKDMTPEQLNEFKNNGELSVDNSTVNAVEQRQDSEVAVEPTEVKDDVVNAINNVVETNTNESSDTVVEELPNKDDYTMFFSLFSPFSNFHPAKFNYDGLTFSSNEQFMMYAKANLFNDTEAMDKIIAVNNNPFVKDFLEGKYTSQEIVGNANLRNRWNEVQKSLKSLGRGVKGYVDATWDKEREFWVKEGASQKFIQNEDLKQLLLSTGDTKMVEASPYDKIWGIGLDEKSALNIPVSQWLGKNLLGKILDAVKSDLKNNLIVAHEAPVVDLPNKDEYLAFETVKSPLNNLFPAKFFYEGLTFSSNEQFLMLGKAQVFSDYDSFDKIMAINELPMVKDFLNGVITDKDIVTNPDLLDKWTSIQKEIISYGRGVKNYNDDVWVKEREGWVKDGLEQKFAQNDHLSKWLVSTGEKKIVKLGTESVWGINLSAADFFNTPVSQWNGSNLLGKALEETRENVKNNNIIIYSDPLEQNPVNNNSVEKVNTPVSQPNDVVDKNEKKDVAPAKTRAKEESKSELYNTNDYHFFYSLFSPFSNFYPAKFEFKGITFSSSEQFYMFSKAKFFKNDELANKIMSVNENPLIQKFLNGEVSANRILKYHSEEWFNLTLEIKKIGRSFPRDNEEWNSKRESPMGVALREKFGQNEDLKQALLKTGDKILVEASPKDSFWGAGLSKEDILNVTPDKWPGQNVLGQWLGHLKEKLRLSAEPPEEEVKKTKGRHP